VECFTETLQSYASSPTIVLKLLRVLQLGAQQEGEEGREMRAAVSAHAGAMRKLSGVQSLLQRKLTVESKGAASAAKRMGVAAAAPTRAAGTGVVKKSKPSTSAPLSLPFDHHWCLCHGVVSSSPSTPAEKLLGLQAACQHINALMQTLKQQ
jgi:hypothetical protein